MPSGDGSNFFYHRTYNVLPLRSDCKKKGGSHGNLGSLSELRRRRQSGGLGGGPAVLSALRGADRCGGAGARSPGGFTGEDGTGAGLAASAQPCVVREPCWRPGQPWVVPALVWGCPGTCLSWPFFQPSPPPFGGKWSEPWAGKEKRIGGESVLGSSRKKSRRLLTPDSLYFSFISSYGAKTASCPLNFKSNHNILWFIFF